MYRRMMPLVFVLVLYCTPAFGATYSEPIKIADRLSETFESLVGVNSTPNAFAQGKSIKGWFSSENTYIVSDGSSNAGGLYSFGESPDRALGAINSNAKKIVVFGIAIVSDIEIHQVDLKFTGEQWRFGGDTPDKNVLTFDYCVLSTEQYQTGGWGGNYLDTSAPWVNIPELSFYGNSTSNVGPVRLSQQFSRALPTPGMGPDKVIQLRWTAHNNHDGLGIDNFEIRATKGSSGGSNAPRNKWKIIGIAACSGLGITVAGIIVFSIVQWKRNRRLAQYNPVHPEMPSSSSIRNGLGIYNAYARGEREKLIDAHNIEADNKHTQGNNNHNINNRLYECEYGNVEQEMEQNPVVHNNSHMCSCAECGKKITE